MSEIWPGVIEEARRVAEAAEQEGIALRLLGGVAIKVRAKDGLHPAFRREYADHDFITGRGASNAMRKLFESLGHVPRTRFDAMNGRERLLFFYEERDRQVDVFVGSVRMSHEIPFGKRLTLEPKVGGGSEPPPGIALYAVASDHGRSPGAPDG